LNLWLVGVLGYAGLALGTSIAALVNAAALLVLLRRRLSGLNDARLIGALARIAAASALMGGAVLVMDRTLADWLPGDAVATQIVRLLGTIGAGLIVLGAGAHALRIREFQQAVDAVVRRFRRTGR
jgi:putative peptidoglycan lipid II flippase